MIKLTDILNESTPNQVIKDLDKAKNDLLKKVNVLIAKKKKLYSDVDIESPMSADEKKLDKDISDLFSQIFKLVRQKRSVKKESVNERADYKYLTQVILDAKPKYNVSFDKANQSVNIGGVGYKGGSLSRAFKSSGSSSDILNNFFLANKDPQKTKREVEKISKGKIKVSVGKGYGNKPIVYYTLKESVNERYRPNLDSKGWEAAQKVIRQLQSSVFRKLDDDELLEFRKAIADAFNLDGILKEQADHVSPMVVKAYKEYLQAKKDGSGEKEYRYYSKKLNNTYSTKADRDAIEAILKKKYGRY